VARHRGCLENPGPEPDPGQAQEESAAPDLEQAAIAAAARRAEDSALAVRTRERYAQVQALRAQGKGIKPIARQTGLAKETVRRFYRAATVDELLAKVRDGRPSLLDDYKPYLHQRWNQGCTNIRQLHAGLCDRGYKGGYGTIRNHVLPFREAGAAPPAVPGPPKARDLASWILTHPGNLDDDEKEKLAHARERCPHLDALAGHVTEFAKILTGLHAAWNPPLGPGHLGVDMLGQSVRWRIARQPGSMLDFTAAPGHPDIAFRSCPAKVGSSLSAYK
jgi:hypothetical protein